MHALGAVIGHIRRGFAFDRSDIGQDGAGLQTRSDLLGQFAQCTERRTDDYTVCVRHGGIGCIGHSTRDNTACPVADIV